MEALVNKRIAKNTIFLYIRMLLVLIVSLYTSRVILATLGASDYGVYNVVGGVVTIMTFLSGALGASTSRFLTYDLGLGDIEHLSKTFAVALTLHIFVAILVVIFGETFGIWLLYHKLVIPAGRMHAAFWVLQASILTMAANFIQVPFSASIISHEKMSIYAYIGVYDAIAKLAIAYFIVITHYDKLIVYALLLLANALAVLTFYRIYTRKKYEECRFQFVKDISQYKRILKYTGWELLGGVASVSQGQGISIVLNMFFGPVVNAARGITQQISTAVTQLVTNFLLASRPQIIKYCAEKKNDEMYSLTFRTAKFSYLLMLIVVVPLCFEIDFVLKVWLGENVPEYTSFFSVIVLVTGLVSSLHTASLMPYHAIGKLGMGNTIGGILMFMALPITYFMFEWGYPPYWAFIVILVTNFFQQLTTWVIIHHYIPYQYSALLRQVYFPISYVTLLGGISPFIVKHYMNQGWTRFGILLISTELILIMTIYLVALTTSEKDTCKRFVQTKIYEKVKNTQW